MAKQNMLGLHFMDVAQDDMEAAIRDLNPRVVKFAFISPETMFSVMSKFPDVDYIYRPWWRYHNDEAGFYYMSHPDDFKTFRNYMGSRGKGPGQVLTPAEEEKDYLEYFNPRDALLEMIHANSSQIRGNMWHLINAPNSLKKRLFWELYNETGGIGDPRVGGGSRDFFRLERERCFWSAENGFRAAVLSTGVGWEINFGHAQDMGLLQAMHDGKHILAVHGYGCGLINIAHGDFQPIDQAGHLANDFKYYWDNRKILPSSDLNTWLAFRAPRYHDELNRRGYGDIKIVLTEFATSDASANHIILANGFDRPLRGWKSAAQDFVRAKISQTLDPADFTAEQLVYGELQLRQYQSFLIGATIFTYGANPATDWYREFDIREFVYPKLLKKMEAHVWQDDDTPPPPPPTEVGCIAELAEFQPNGQPLTKLNVRNTPYILTNPDNRVGSMERGQTAKALAKARVNGNWWIKLELSNGVTGWASGPYLNLKCNNFELPEVSAPPPDGTPSDDLDTLRRRIAELEAANDKLATEKQTALEAAEQARFERDQIYGAATNAHGILHNALENIPNDDGAVG